MKNKSLVFGILLAFATATVLYGSQNDYQVIKKTQSFQLEGFADGRELAQLDIKNADSSYFESSNAIFNTGFGSEVITCDIRDTQLGDKVKRSVTLTIQMNVPNDMSNNAVDFAREYTTKRIENITLEMNSYQRINNYIDKIVGIRNHKIYKNMSFIATGLGALGIYTFPNLTTTAFLIISMCTYLFNRQVEHALVEDFRIQQDVCDKATIMSRLHDADKKTRLLKGALEYLTGSTTYRRKTNQMVQGLHICNTRAMIISLFRPVDQRIEKFQLIQKNLEKKQS